MADATMTKEDLDWINQPVSVQVEPDNQKWLDAMLEMKQDELISYGVFQYGIPESAANASDRDSLVQLIVMANKAGGGQSVLRTRYRYLKGIEGLVPPQIVVRGKRPLYLTRGEGTGTQVYHKVNNEWLPYAQMARATAQASTPTAAEAAAHQAAMQQPQTVEVEVEKIVEVEKPKIFLKPTRAQVEEMAVQYGVGTAEEVKDLEKYPSMQHLVDAIEGNSYNASDAADPADRAGVPNQ